MKEMESLYAGLLSGSTMLVKETDNALECSFIKEGLVQRVVRVKDAVLALALQRKTELGILEGENYHQLRNYFDSFVLHVKSRKLYLDLRFKLKRVEGKTAEVVAA